MSVLTTNPFQSQLRFCESGDLGNTQGWGLVAKGTSHVIGGWNFQPRPYLQGGEKGLRLN